jgi:hypothetical protein
MTKLNDAVARPDMWFYPGEAPTEHIIVETNGVSTPVSVVETHFRHS